ncbi:hypothetical protein [Halodesulfovibrio sp.]|uniref:hypothetical protein n=1 Tax=Halodesulfovibrio sp. TaxID=1912772 RepID=UPI0025F0903A|nr:hypothetical protein [Halodesulfovibrio sp.]MCT4533955.1 hypothetical protein [Halodesulfovibrio sp.]MCT4627322.1 hypothetical protein [Halodesulfovibrio sp.]
MAYEIKLVKLVSGDMLIGKANVEDNMLTDVAVLQTVPTQQGVQMMLLPFGYPFEQDFDAKISTEHVIYEYKECPEDLKTKYLEATSNLTVSTGGLGNLDLQGGAGGNVTDISQLLKK